MKLTPLLVIACSFIFSCTPPSEEADCDDCNEPIHAASIYPMDGLVFVKEGYQDTVLSSEFFFTDNEQLYFNSTGITDVEMSWPVSIQTDVNLKVASVVYDDLYSGVLLDTTQFVDTLNTNQVLLEYAYRLHFQSECNLPRPRFISVCMNTFGHHRKKGNTMFYTLKRYTECGMGVGFCLEPIRRIGRVVYYMDDNCNDTPSAIGGMAGYACEVWF